MKIRNKKTGKITNVSSLDEWKEKFFKENGSIKDQFIESAENPTTHKNKIKDWIKDNPKPTE